MNRESKFSLSKEFDGITSNDIDHINQEFPNPKDYEGTTHEGEDEEFLPKKNFRGTYEDNEFYPS